MRNIWIGVVIVGALAGGVIAQAYAALATGDDNLDRWQIRLRVLMYSFFYGVDPQEMMGIVHQESDGNPANYLGDVSASGGPSIGPCQVERTTAISSGLWSPPAGSTDNGLAAYTALATDPGIEDFGIRWGCAVRASKPSLAAYNGSGSAAQAYAASVQDFIAAAYAPSTSNDSST